MMQQKEVKTCEDNDEEEKENMWEHFASNTTAHGFAQIVINKQPVLKFIWIFVIIGFNITLSFQIKPLIDRYLERPVKTRLYRKGGHSQEFPMLTICNSNIIKKSKAPLLIQTKYYNDYFNLTGTENITQEKHLENLNDRHAILTILSSIAQEERDEVFKYGHTFEEMFMECKWKAFYNCLDKKLWKPLWHWRFGSCYTLTFPQDDEDLFISSVPAPKGGIDLMLFLNQPEYFSENVTKTAGIIVQIGERGEFIEPGHRSVNMAPNFAYFVGMSTTQIKRTDPFDNNSCVNDMTNHLGSRWFSQEVIHKYSLHLCKDICLAQTQAKSCGCTGHWLPSLNNYRVCKHSDKECIEDVDLKFLRDKLPCLKACQPACREQRYDLHTSFRAYPTENMRNKFYPDSYKDNIVKLILYFDSLSMTVIEDKQYYFIENLLGDIGGQLGLWSGFSLMTVVEVIFLFIHVCFISFVFLVRNVCSAKNNRDKRKTDDLSGDQAVNIPMKIKKISVKSDRIA